MAIRMLEIAMWGIAQNHLGITAMEETHNNDLEVHMVQTL